MFNPLQPSGYYKYHQFNLKQFYVLHTQSIYVFCVDLRRNSDYFPTHHWLTGFYNRSRECLLRGTNWVFKSDRYSFVLKGLMNVCFNCQTQHNILKTIHASTGCFCLLWVIVMLKLEWRVRKIIQRLNLPIHIYALIYVIYRIISYKGIIFKRIQWCLSC
jgi:hypothetical protein